MKGDQHHLVAPAASAQARRAHSNQASLRADSGERVQAWRAWSGCGDGAQVHLIIDPSARQVWLLQAGEPNPKRRSVP